MPPKSPKPETQEPIRVQRRLAEICADCRKKLRPEDLTDRCEACRVRRNKQQRVRYRAKKGDTLAHVWCKHPLATGEIKLRLRCTSTARTPLLDRLQRCAKSTGHEGDHTNWYVSWPVQDHEGVPTAHYYKRANVAILLKNSSGE